MRYAMFLVVSFALVRGYHDAPLAAGVKLAIVPVALGLVAPASGGLAQAHPRLVPLAGMAICIAAAVTLERVMTGAPGSLPAVIATLAAFGAGLGMFVAPNNTATMSAAPAQRAGHAGGLLNLLRVFGTGLGIAAASSVLSWRLSTHGSATGRSVGVPEATLLAAVGEVLLMVAACAAVAGATTLVCSRPPDA